MCQIKIRRLLPLRQTCRKDLTAASENSVLSAEDAEVVRTANSHVAVVVTVNGASMGALSYQERTWRCSEKPCLKASKTEMME